MKKVVSLIFGAFVLFGSILYLAGAFSQASFNLQSWSDYARQLVAISWFVLVLIASIVVIGIKSYEK